MPAITTRILGAVAIGVMVAMPAWSQDPAAAPQAEPVQEQVVVDEWMYGYEVLNEAERAAYRERVLNAPSDEARARFRAMHRIEMMHRAEERGVTLATEAPAPAPQAAETAEAAPQP